MFTTLQREIGLTASPTSHDLRIHVSRDRHLSGSLLGGTNADRKNAGEENGVKQSSWHGVPPRRVYWRDTLSLPYSLSGRKRLHPHSVLSPRNGLIQRSCRQTAKPGWIVFETRP